MLALGGPAVAAHAIQFLARAGTVWTRVPGSATMRAMPLDLTPDELATAAQGVPGDGVLGRGAREADGEPDGQGANRGHRAAVHDAGG